MRSRPGRCSAGLGQFRRFFPQDRRHRLRRRGRGMPSPPRASRRGSRRTRRCPIGVGRLALDLLRRHVAESPEHDARLRGAGRRRQARRVGPCLVQRQLGQAEVEDLDAAVLRDEQVLGFQIPVDDPLFVRRGEAVSDLQRVVDRLLAAAACPPESAVRRVSPSSNSWTT